MAQRRDAEDEISEDRASRFVDEGVFAFSIEDEDGNLIDPSTGQRITPKQNKERLAKEGEKLAEQAESQREEDSAE